MIVIVIGMTQKVKISRIGRSAIIQVLSQRLYLLHNLTTIGPFTLQFTEIRFDLFKLLQDELSPAVSHTHLLTLVVLVVVNPSQARSVAGIFQVEAATVPRGQLLCLVPLGLICAVDRLQSVYQNVKFLRRFLRLRGQSILVILVEPEPELLDRTGVGYCEGGVDVRAACISFGDDAFGDRATMGHRPLRCLEYFKSPEEVGLLFLAEEAKQRLQSLAIIIIVPHVPILLGFLLEQHKLLKEQRRSLEHQPGHRLSQDRLALLVHPKNYKQYEQISTVGVNHSALRPRLRALQMSLRNSPQARTSSRRPQENLRNMLLQRRDMRCFTQLYSWLRQGFQVVRVPMWRSARLEVWKLRLRSQRRISSRSLNSFSRSFSALGRRGKPCDEWMLCFLPYLSVSPRTMSTRLGLTDFTQGTDLLSLRMPQNLRSTQSFRQQCLIISFSSKGEGEGGKGQILLSQMSLECVEEQKREDRGCCETESSKDRGVGQGLRHLQVELLNFLLCII